MPPPGPAPRPELREIPARQPLFWAALAFATGIWIGRIAWRPLTWWVIAVLVFVAAAVYFLDRRPRVARALALAASAFMGALVVQAPKAAVDSAGGWLDDGKEVEVVAHVISEGTLEAEGPGSWRQRIDVETEEIVGEDRFQEAAIGLRLNIYSRSSTRYDLDETAPAGNAAKSTALAPELRLFHYGERLRFAAKLVTPRNYGNPGALDYAGYIRDQGIVASASIKLAQLQVLPGFRGNRFDRALAGAHRSIVDRVHELWGPEDAALIDAMLIGEKAFIERPVRMNFQRSGTYHILVVSGMNVAILAGVVLWTFRRLRFGEPSASLCSMAIIFAYAELTKQGAPVWRAAVMFAAYLLARLLYRKRAVMNALGAAALLLLVIDPNSLFGASFQMSFLCVVLLAGIGVPVVERTSQPFARGLRNLDALAYDRSLPANVAQFRLDLRLVLQRMESVLPEKRARPMVVRALRAVFAATEIVLLSGFMQLGMALPMAFYFHRATSVGVLANVLAVPLLDVLMPAAVLAVALSYVWKAIASLPALISHFAVQGLAGTVHWFGGWQVADVRLPTPASFVVIFCSISMVACLVLVRRRAWQAITGIALLLAGTASVWTIAPREQVRSKTLEMTAIDVGQGDSVLLVMPDGGKVLVDGGGLPFWMHSQMDIGEDVVSPYLWTRGISRLDAVALTHAHADHMAGLLSIIPNFRPRELWLPQTVPLEEIRSLLQVAQQYAVRMIFLRSSDMFDFGGATVRVLAPDPEFPVRSGHRNDESLIMKVSYGETSALLEADAERGTEKLILREQPQADVLKVAHHGSVSATNEDFLAVVHPKFAVISVGRNNVYHHPRFEVLDRLQNHGVLTYRTDFSGATTFYLDGKGVSVLTPGLP